MHITNKIHIIATLIATFVLVIHLVISFAIKKLIGTPIMTIALYLFFYCVLVVIIKSICKQSIHLSKILIIVFGITTCLVLVYDFIIRNSQDGIEYKCYSEKNGDFYYVSGYNFHNFWLDKVHISPYFANSSRVETKTEFSYEYSYNNFGFRRNGEAIIDKTKNKYKIVAVGDSWTEGIGTPDSLTFPFLIQKKLRSNNKNVRIFNCGRAGNDPINVYGSLPVLFEKYNPEHVILTLSNSDVNDVIAKGGKNRVRENGKVAFKTGPWWEFFYANSFVFRVFIRDYLDYTHLLIQENKLKNEYDKVLNELHNAIILIESFCKKNDAELSIIFVPGYWQMKFIERGETRMAWKVMIALNEELLEKGFHTIYLPDCYFPKLANKKSQDYWWKYDYHHTPLGYEMMSECILENLNIDSE